MSIRSLRYRIRVSSKTIFSGKRETTKKRKFSRLFFAFRRLLQRPNPSGVWRINSNNNNCTDNRTSDLLLIYWPPQNTTLSRVANRMSVFAFIRVRPVGIGPQSSRQSPWTRCVNKTEMKTNGGAQSERKYVWIRHKRIYCDSGRRTKRQHERWDNSRVDFISPQHSNDYHI